MTKASDLEEKLSPIYLFLSGDGDGQLIILAFETCVLFGISNDCLWARYGYFLEPHSNYTF